MEKNKISGAAIQNKLFFVLLIVGAIACGPRRQDNTPPPPPPKSFYMMIDKIEKNNGQIQNAPETYNFVYTVDVYVDGNKVDNFNYCSNEYLRTGDTMKLIPTTYSIDTTKVYLILNGDSIMSKTIQETFNKKQK